MIPDLTADGILPEGVHVAAWEEFAQRFIQFQKSDRRIRLGERILDLIQEARDSGIVLRVLIAGSFVTSKNEPDDFDGILVLDPETAQRTLAPFQYNLFSRRRARKRFGGDVVPVLEDSQALQEYLEFFQTTRAGERMGIVELVL